MNADRLVGETAMVTEPIDACADTGAVKINGVLWTAKCTTGERVEAGGHVTIERVRVRSSMSDPQNVPVRKHNHHKKRTEKPKEEQILWNGSPLL